MINKLKRNFWIRTKLSLRMIFLLLHVIFLFLSQESKSTIDIATPFLITLFLFLLSSSSFLFLVFTKNLPKLVIQKDSLVSFGDPTFFGIIWTTSWELCTHLVILGFDSWKDGNAIRFLLIRWSSETNSYESYNGLPQSHTAFAFSSFSWSSLDFPSMLLLLHLSHFLFHSCFQLYN